MKMSKNPAGVWSVLVVSLLLASPPVSAAGPDFDLNDYKGRVVVVDFWASWCVPCRRSFPWLDAMQKKYREQGLVVIGINLDAEQGAASSFLEKFPVSFDIVYDLNGDLAREYDVIAMPSSYVIDRNGQVSERHLGFKTARMQEYEALLQSLLNQDPSLAAR